MKITSDKWQVTSDTNRQRARGGSVFSCHPSPVTRHHQRGVALVITLILLSVTLVMTLAFLAISGRERGSVATQTDTTTTRLAADTGLAAAEAQIAANILSTTNPYSFGLLVSTNYPPLTYANPADFTNLQFSPRAPVWLTNLVAGGMENRFYLDLNRNGVDDPNGWVLDSATSNFVFEVGDPEWIGVLERPDLPYGPNNHFIARFAFIALPVGNSLDLNAIHNQALSSARTTKAPNPIAPDYYFRNQGVGSWELNLPAFLADLNVNEWDPNTAPYNYLQPNFANTGRAFEDAFVLLTNRYAGTYTTLRSVNALFGPPGVGGTAFANDTIDGYTDGQLQTTIDTNTDFAADNANAFWVGADNTNHYFTPEELFNTNETASFGINLLNAGTGASAYDRYTFYRMLSQLGTDTTPESGKMNLNYDNLDPGFNGFSTTNGTASATNFVPWQPLAFFTNAADRMLKAYTAQWFQSGPSNYLQTYYGISGYSYSHWDPSGTYTVINDPSGLGLTNVPFFGMTNQIPAFGLTDIPVWVNTNLVYTPAIQRVLQLAANIYDATTQNYYPSVFRPLFSTNLNGGYVNVFITGYTNIEPIPGPDPSVDSQLNRPVDASVLAATPFLPNNMPTNVYGVPWIIGAKKGFPNFNAFTMETVFGITRKLQVTRGDTDHDSLSYPPVPYTISQQLSLGITNLLGVEFWNSYRANHTNEIDVYVTDTSTTFLTNDEGTMPTMPLGSGVVYTNIFPIPSALAVPAVPGWPGYGYNSIPQQGSFIVPLSVYEPALPGSNYTFNVSAPFAPISPSYFVTNTPTLLSPHWGLMVTNRLRVIMVEKDTAIPPYYHIVDYAQLIGPDSSHDVSTDIQDLYDTGVTPEYDDQWDPNLAPDGIPTGIDNQIGVSMGHYFDDNTYKTYWGSQDKEQVINQLDGFLAFYGYSPMPDVSSPNQDQYIAIGQTSVAQQAPYTPSAVIVYQTKWEVNDPLVHYLASDLTDFNQTDGPTKYIIPFAFTVLNARYMPWGGNPKPIPPGGDSSFNAVNRYDSAIKDPLVSLSDNWDFPTNKLPTAGWLGRVHRGTPWQTVYLKSSDVPNTPVLITVGTNLINLPTWAYLNGNLNTFDATNTAPVQDRLLFDLFTTAFNDNATRGTLSVNQSADQYDPDGNPADINPAAGLAAWSAVFSGMIVLSNNAPDNAIPSPPSTVAFPINPAGSSGANSALGQIVATINQKRANFVNGDGLAGSFEHAGDILRVPQLTDQSPFLHLSNYNATANVWVPDTAQLQNGISDAMYEWLPQQTMSLLRVGTPRYVIYSYGQALKPAPNGTFLGAGPFFGMVTNYQVVSEIATRAVLRLDTVRTNANGAATMTPPRAVIESFNILPPD